MSLSIIPLVLLNCKLQNLKPDITKGKFGYNPFFTVNYKTYITFFL